MSYSLLERYEEKLPVKAHVIIDCAADDQLFVKHRFKPDLEHSHSTRELFDSVTLLDHLIAFIRPAYNDCRADDRIKQLSEPGHQEDPAADALFLANIEHLLLCIRETILHVLIFGHALEQILKHLIECQKQKRLRGEEWFFEFPNARHPLSTRWPWSIRPSLAVLWGVCWMYYDREVHSSSDLDFAFDCQGNLIHRATGTIMQLGYDCQALLSGRFIFKHHCHRGCPVFG